MSKWLLISTNDFHAPDNIQGRIQTEAFPTYQEAYIAMTDSLMHYVEEDRRELVLSGVEFSDVVLGKYEARSNRDFGKVNNYWKIVEVE